MMRESGPTPTGERPDINTYTRTYGISSGLSVSGGAYNIGTDSTGNHLYTGRDTLYCFNSTTGGLSGLQTPYSSSLSMGNKPVAGPILVKDANTIYYHVEDRTSYYYGIARIDMNNYDLTSATITTEITFNRSDIDSISISPDGSSIYIAFYCSTNVSQPILQYELSTPRDFTTAVANIVGYVTYSGSSHPYTYLNADSSNFRWKDICVSPTGEKIWISPYDSTGAIRQYTLSTAYDLTTASYDSKYLNPYNYDKVLTVTEGGRIFTSAKESSSQFLRQYDSSS